MDIVYNIMMRGDDIMKKYDVIFIGFLFILSVIGLIVFQLIERVQATGEVYAKIFYQDQLILMIDLNTNQSIIYNTPYQSQIDTSRSNEGIFYVPGTTTTDMTLLYQEDDYAREKGIVGIKIMVVDHKIRVVYQESPRDLCQLQSPTNSRLRPIVCLPNELVISVYTNMETDEFIPDAILE